MQSKCHSTDEIFKAKATFQLFLSSSDAKISLLLAHRNGSDHRSQRRHRSHRNHRVARDLLGLLKRMCFGEDASGRALFMTYGPVMDAKQVDASS